MGSLPMMQLEWCVFAVACASNPTQQQQQHAPKHYSCVSLHRAYNAHTFLPRVPPFQHLHRRRRRRHRSVENDLAHMREIRSPLLWVVCGAVGSSRQKRSVGKAHEVQCGAVSEQTSTPGRQTTATVAAPRMHTLSHSRPPALSSRLRSSISSVCVFYDRHYNIRPSVCRLKFSTYTPKRNAKTWSSWSPLGQRE